MIILCGIIVYRITLWWHKNSKRERSKLSPIPSVASKLFRHSRPPDRGEMIVYEYRDQLAAIYTADWIPRSHWLYSRLDITRPWQSPSCKRRNSRGTSALDWFYSESRKASFSISLSFSLWFARSYLLLSLQHYRPVSGNHSLITSKMTYTYEAADGARE